jgi:hypothetical protein
MIRRSRLIPALSALTLVAACGTMGNSNVVRLGGTLSGQQEVPPVTTGGASVLDATLDKASNKLAYTVTYSGLSGPATAAHFHGPAENGKNAGIVVGFANPASPIQGEATLTPAQAADLLAGKWYVNVHTGANRGGEIRAQVLPK